jgi:hypothetical protein
MENELVTVRDVYGHKYRVARADLEDPGRVMLPTYNQFGRKLSHATKVDFSKCMLHRDNIAQ